MTSLYWKWRCGFVVVIDIIIVIGVAKPKLRPKRSDRDVSSGFLGELRRVWEKEKR